MRSIQKAAWLSVVLAASALAQEEAAEVTPPEPPRWSVGAGASFNFPGFGGSWLLGYAGAYLYTSALGILGASTSLEYAFTPRVSVSFGFSGTYSQRERVEPDAAASRHLAYGAALAVGPRGYLNDGPTRVSVHALVFGVLAEANNDFYPQYLGATPAERAGGIGVSAGFAVDQVLFERLSIRAGLDVVSASFGFHRDLTENFRPVPGSQARTAVSVGLALGPRFELRLAF